MCQNKCVWLFYIRKESNQLSFLFLKNIIYIGFPFLILFHDTLMHTHK